MPSALYLLCMALMAPSVLFAVLTMVVPWRSRVETVWELLFQSLYWIKYLRMHDGEMLLWVCGSGAAAAALLYAGAAVDRRPFGYFAMAVIGAFCVGLFVLRFGRGQYWELVLAMSLPGIVCVLISTWQARNLV